MEQFKEYMEQTTSLPFTLLVPDTGMTLDVVTDYLTLGFPDDFRDYSSANGPKALNVQPIPKYGSITTKEIPIIQQKYFLLPAELRIGNEDLEHKEHIEEAVDDIISS